MLINGVSGDAGSFVEKLASGRLASPFVAARQRRKYGKHQPHRWNIAQHNRQFCKSWKLHLGQLSVDWSRNIGSCFAVNIIQLGLGPSKRT
jgi:hypothetical protein